MDEEAIPWAQCFLSSAFITQGHRTCPLISDRRLVTVERVHTFPDNAGLIIAMDPGSDRWTFLYAEPNARQRIFQGRVWCAEDVAYAQPKSDVVLKRYEKHCKDSLQKTYLLI